MSWSTRAALPGAAEFFERLVERERRFLVLTNNSIFTPRDLSARLRRSGLEVPEEIIWTSALATAQFLSDQLPHGSAYALGEAGLTTALWEVGYTLTDTDPDYVVLGETRTYSFEAITRAIRLIEGGARFIATNPDPTGPSAEGSLPATGAVAAMITRATGRDPYFVGKPNPMMFRSAMNRIEAHSETTAMIGARMETDVVAGSEAACGPIRSPRPPADPRERLPALGAGPVVTQPLGDVVEPARLGRVHQQPDRGRVGLGHDRGLAPVQAVLGSCCCLGHSGPGHRQRGVHPGRVSLVRFAICAVLTPNAESCPTTPTCSVRVSPVRCSFSRPLGHQPLHLPRGGGGLVRDDHDRKRR